MLVTGKTSNTFKKVTEKKFTEQQTRVVPDFPFLADDDDDENRSFVHIFPLRGNI